MKADWRTVPLGEVSVVIAGQSPKGSAYNDSGIGLPFYQGKKEFGNRHIGAPTTWTSEVTKVAEAGDILMSVRAPVGPINEATEKICIGRGLAAIRAKNGLNRDFLWHVLQWLQPTIKGNAGAVFESINKTAIEQLSIPLPAAEEQQRIAAILDEAFEGVDQARANAEANLQNAQELFESFRESLLDPSRRQGWLRRKLDDLITIKHGFAFKSAFFQDSGQYAVLTPGNFWESGGFRDRGERQRYYSGEFPPQFILKKDDLLMAMTEQAPGLLGSCIVVPSDDKFLHNQRLGLISPKSGVSWLPEYFAQAFNLHAFRKALSDTCSGATVRHTSPGRILAQSIPYTDDKKALEAVASELAECQRECEKLQRGFVDKLQNLDNLRQSLLRKAFAGELT